MRAIEAAFWHGATTAVALGFGNVEESEARAIMREWEQAKRKRERGIIPVSREMAAALGFEFVELSDAST